MKTWRRLLRLDDPNAALILEKVDITWTVVLVVERVQDYLGNIDRSDAFSFALAWMKR